MKFSIRLLYLYLFSFVGLLIVVIGSVQLVNLGIRTYIFPQSDNYYDLTPAIMLKAPDGEISSPSAQVDQEKINRLQVDRQRQRDFTNSISMIIIGLPLYLYHWRTIQNQKSTN